MPQTNSYNQKSGQILLIFIIALAILSIFVVVIAINVRRDTVETAQNDQYEAFYSLAEEKLLKLLSGETLDECVIEPIGNNYNCDIAYEGTTVQLQLTETTSNEFENYPLEKDKSIMISLDDGTPTGYQGVINFSYSGASADWNSTIDYIDSNGFYSVSKIVYSSEAIYSGTPDNGSCVFSEGTVISFEIQDCFAGGRALAIRMKPIMTTFGTVNLSLGGTADLPAQMRTIEAVSNVEQLSAEAGSTPRIVLQIMQPIHEVPIEILDYVLRSETEVDK